jgi:putative membrane-bound dehydrogenase-like protein
MNAKALPIILLWLIPLTARAQDRPLPPQEAPKAMTLPKGFIATLFAGEPDVVQPIAFTFDDRGRLWVVECLSYPKWRNDRTGNDRIVVFEDTYGDGRFDKKTVVWDKGPNLSGIELGFGGVWLCSLPDLLFIPCDFNADVPKLGEPKTLLDGWDMKAQHNVFNSLTWGPDGWLYGCNGILSNSKVGKPGTPEKDRVPMSCGVWRYHPTRQVFEAFAHGTTNPWGLDFNEDGEMFITNCVIKHIWHVVPGAHFERMFGQDMNPHVYKLMPSIADHIHWGGGDWTSSRGGKGVHDSPGGGHAHTGCMVYLGDNWPDEYRGNVFMCNIHGNRINRDFLEPKGSTYVAKHGPDFMLANDPWFRGIAIKYGPDGGVFVTDWTDTGECHNYEVVDRTNGRVFKITYGKPKPWRGDVSKLSDVELVKLQTQKNEWFVQHARRLLQERAAAGRLDPMAINELRECAENRSAEQSLRLKALWSLHASGTWNLQKMSQDSWIWLDSVQRWKIRLCLDEFRQNGKALAALDIKSVLQLKSPLMKRTILSGLLWLPPSERLEHIPATRIGRIKEGTKEPLLDPKSCEDPYLPLLLWYCLEPEIVTNPVFAVDALEIVGAPFVRESIARRLTENVSVDSKGFEDLFDFIGVKANSVAAIDVLRGIQVGLAGHKRIPMPKAWPEAFKALRASPHEEVRERAMQLAVLFGDEKAIAELMRTLREPKAKPEKRIAALELLLQKQLPELLPAIRTLLDEPALRGAAIRGLASFNAADTPELILNHYPNLSDTEKPDAIQTLASRPSYALALLDAVEKGEVPRKDVSPFVARQILSLKNKETSEKLTKVWGTIRPASQQRTALTKKYRAILTEEALKKADRAKGRQVFAKTCASCHRLFDDGNSIGPDLTGSQRTNLDYILENVLDPSAVVAREYQVTVFELKNGRVLNGIIAQETERAVTVQTQNEKLVVPKEEIEARTPTNVSMMPEGLFDKLSDEEVRNLVAYLMGKNQVPK